MVILQPPYKMEHSTETYGPISMYDPLLERSDNSLMHGSLDVAIFTGCRRLKVKEELWSKISTSRQ